MNTETWIKERKMRDLFGNSMIVHDEKNGLCIIHIDEYELWQKDPRPVYTDEDHAEVKYRCVGKFKDKLEAIEALVRLQP